MSKQKRPQATQKEQLQRLIRLYREKTGEEAIDMHEVAKYAEQLGWRMPKPKTPIDLLAAKLSDAAREETRIDPTTGRPYRANLAVTSWTPSGQMTFWHDIDQAPRRVAHKSFTQRREQMVGDAVQLTLDIDHWNRANSADMPIDMPMDLTQDVEWRLNAPPDEEAGNEAA